MAIGKNRWKTMLKWTGVALLALVFYAGWKVLPMASGYGAKNLCSCLFVAQRADNHVLHNELAFFPVNLGSYTVNRTDSSVTGTVWGMAKQKALYRSGYGCTLVNDISESELLKQPRDFNLHRLADSVPSIFWPDGDSIPPHIQPTVDTARLQAAVARAFVESDAPRPIRTRAVVVVYKGQIIGEQYADGFSRTSRLMGWSMAKSVTSALVGIAVKRGLLKIDQPAPVDAFQQASDGRRKITTRNLLQQTSGIDFNEIYSRPSEVTQMLFREGNMAAYVEGLHAKQPPGSEQYYSSGNTNILMSVLRTVLPPAEYHSFPYRELFHPIGMRSAIIETDASGAFVGSSYMYATARDWARFGLLYLQQGRWNQDQLLPANWVSQSVVPALKDSKIQYGFQWWLNTENAAGVKKYPTLPSNLYYADGYESQFVFVIPNNDLVIVRLGLTQGPYFNEEQFVHDVIDAVK